MLLLLVGLLISVGVLLMVAIAVASYIRRQRSTQPEDRAQEPLSDTELGLSELGPKHSGSDNESSD